MNYTKLKTELDDDPLDRGYAQMSDAEVASDLNTERRERNRASLSGDEMFQQTDPAEYVALTDHKRNLWTAFTTKAGVDPWATNNVEFVKWLFGDASQTVANLAAIRTETVSREDELGLGHVREGHVAKVRR